MHPVTVPFHHLPTGFLQRPPANGLDLPCILRHRDEAGRIDVAQCGMMPPRQGLDPVQAPGHGFHLRLVMQLQHALGQRVPQRGTQHQPFLRHLVLFMPGEAVQATPVFLRLPGRGIGQAEQGFAVRPVFGEGADADTARNAQRILTHLQGLGDRIDQVFGKLLRTPVRTVGHDNDEFIPTRTADDIFVIDQCADAATDLDQETVGIHMAQRVIDIAETVDIHHEQRELAVPAPHDQAFDDIMQ